MEEPLQPRAPQLWAGALREQSGESATPASLGGPALSPQALPAPARSSPSPQPPASPSCLPPVAHPAPEPETPNPLPPPCRLASPLCCHQGQSGTSAPSPTPSHLPGSLGVPFLNFIHPGIQLSGSPITNSLAPTHPSRPLSGPSVALRFQGPSPGLPHLGLLAGWASCSSAPCRSHPCSSAAIPRPVYSWVVVLVPSFQIHPLAPPCPAVAGCVLQSVLIFALSPWRRSPPPPG